MAKTTTRGRHYDTILACNVRQLSDRWGSVNAFSGRFGLNQSTMNRLATGKQSPTMKLLGTISAATGYLEWQLLHPEFHPRKMPPGADARAMQVAATFASIRSEADKKKAEALVEQFATFEDPPAPAAEPKQPQHQDR